MAGSLSTIRGNSNETASSVSSRLDRVQDQWAQILNSFMTLTNTKFSNVSGTFTSNDSKTIIVKNGIIVDIK